MAIILDKDGREVALEPQGEYEQNYFRMDGYIVQYNGYDFILGEYDEEGEFIEVKRFEEEDEARTVALQKATERGDLS